MVGELLEREWVLPSHLSFVEDFVEAKLGAEHLDGA
jgi:hypothetical protein